jgi:dsDNA-specific endonuclease/ATPase MutS2
MTKWLMLILAVLAGGGGWYWGSASGRDALDSLAKARDEAREAKAELAKVQTSLNKDLAQLQTKYTDDQQRLQESNSRAQAEFTRLLDGRDKRIADLGTSHKAAQGNISELAKVLANPGTTAADRLRVQGQIDELTQKLAQTQVLIEGLSCSKVAVPAELLKPMREDKP